MQNDTTITVHVALDVHKDSIVASYSVGLGEVQSLGNIGVMERDITKLCMRMQSKGSRVSFAEGSGSFILALRGIALADGSTDVAHRAGFFSSRCPRRGMPATRDTHNLASVSVVDAPRLRARYDLDRTGAAVGLSPRSGFVQQFV